MIKYIIIQRFQRAEKGETRHSCLEEARGHKKKDLFQVFSITSIPSNFTHVLYYTEWAAGRSNASSKRSVGKKKWPTRRKFLSVEVFITEWHTWQLHIHTCTYRESCTKKEPKQPGWVNNKKLNKESFLVKNIWIIVLRDHISKQQVG